MIGFPSRRAKESIKTALAMTLAYGLALSWGWDKPMWAGFAVAFCSLATIGQSFRKEVFRMAGTLVAAAFALLLMARFPQDRWGFMIALSMYIGVCTYFTAGKKAHYFWHVCGFVCVIICMETGIHVDSAFDLAVLRIEETGLGVLCYSLVTLLVWPSSSREPFWESLTELAAAQRQLLADSLSGRPSSAPVFQNQTRFAQMLDAAVADSAEIGEQRPAWQVLCATAFELTDRLARWNQSFHEIEPLDRGLLLPGWPDFCAELDQRLTQIERMLTNQPPDALPKPVVLELDSGALNALTDFQRAAMTAAWQRLQALDRITCSLFDQVAGLKEFRPLPVTEAVAAKSGFVFDPDQGLAAFRVMLAAWIAYLALIYVDCIPGGNALVTMSCSIGLGLSTMPQVPIQKLWAPIFGAIGFSGMLYLLIMPQLSTFMELGCLLFLVVFSICYFFYDQRQALGRACGLALFVSVASISNEQSYSFLVVATPVLTISMALIVLMFTAHIPFSARPERVTIRLLQRFFRSVDALLSNPQPSTWVARQVHRFHRAEVTNLPAKINSWLPWIHPVVLKETQKENVQAVLASVQVLSYQMTEWVDDQARTKQPHLEKILADEFMEWSRQIQGSVQCLAADPSAGESSRLHSRLMDIRKRLEKKWTADHVFGTADAIDFYYRLDVFRGLSESLMAYVKQSETVSWGPWKEERF